MALIKRVAGQKLILNYLTTLTQPTIKGQEGQANQGTMRVAVWGVCG